MVGNAEFHRIFGRFGFFSCGNYAAKSFSLLPTNVSFVHVGDVDLLVRWFPEVPIAGAGVARNCISSLIWRFYGPKWDILDYWVTVIFCLLSYDI